MLKEFVGRILSLVALLILLPLFITIGILIYIDDKGPIFFVQKRIKKDEEYFDMYKFRTMYTTAPSYVPTEKMVHDGTNVTNVGKFLRKTSLDELPQLINVIKGDMALVGPRPCLSVEKELVEARRNNGAFSVKPGITGLAQVNGRDNIDDQLKSFYDGVYAKNQSFALDVKIIIKSILVVFKRDNVKG